jgi:DNA replication and repair protein RecF
MKLNRLSISAFRNIEQAELVPGSNFNVLYGNNAQGKTNLLESIYLLGTMKSFRHARNRDLVTWHAPHGIIRGWVERDGVTREIALLLEREGKKARIDHKMVTRLAEFFGNLNVVVFAPEELAMLKGAPEGRRRYLDRAVFSGSPTYILLYHEYHRLLKNRNALLKSGESTGLDIWSEQLAEAGARMVRERLAYLAVIEPLLQAFYRTIAGSGESVGIAYHPHCLERDALSSDGRNAILAGLARTASEERRHGTTVIGPHRDDLEFTLDGRLLKLHASQGQQRSFILALKMAEIEYLQQTFGAPPILLLDDMTSELDGERNRNLLGFLQQKEMQVFITTTSLGNIMLDNMDHHTTFHVEKGKIIT